MATTPSPTVGKLSRRRRDILSTSLLCLIVLFSIAHAVRAVRAHLRLTSGNRRAPRLARDSSVGGVVNSAGGAGAVGVGVDLASASATAPTPSTKYAVPHIAHFVFGMEPGFGHVPFGLMHYIALLGTKLYVAPESIQWHHRFLPNETENGWWACARPLVVPRLVDDVTTVHGKEHKDLHVAHKADVVRMRIMREEGGIYLDSDVIPLRSFDELRRIGGNKLIMGREVVPGQDGMANAVLVGAPNTSFINRWWAAYANFNPQASWAYHSVILPREIAAKHPDEIIILGGNTFFRPTWAELTELYELDDQYDFIDNFAVHLWTSAENKRYGILRKLSTADVWSGNGSFYRVARHVLNDALAAGILCDAAKADMTDQHSSERVGRSVIPPPF